MDLNYRERLIMHAFYPKRQHAANPSALKTLLFYAALLELYEAGLFSMDGNRIVCSGGADHETDNKVLDAVLKLVAPLSGKNISRLQFVVPQKSGRIYRLQIEEMVASMLLREEEITFLSWKIGTRYRVRKYDRLKPSIKMFERTLVYGRKPDKETWRMALLVAEGNLYGNLFASREFRRRAKGRYKELLESDIHTSDHTVAALHKSLIRILTAQKAKR